MNNEKTLNGNERFTCTECGAVGAVTFETAEDHTGYVCGAWSCGECGADYPDLEAQAAELLASVDPYGSLVCCIGNEDDFICIDYAISGNIAATKSVVNSETGSFIDRFDSWVGPVYELKNALDCMFDSAMVWACDGEVPMTQADTEESMKSCDRLIAEIDETD